MTPRKVTKAIIPAAGLGTRFLPATKAMPKEMLTVVNKPIIQYAVEEAYEAGIREFIIITGRGKTAMENHFDHPYELADTLTKKNKTAELALVTNILPQDARLFYTRQGEPLGLGHAVACAAGFTNDEPFAVLLPDVVACTQGHNPTKLAVDLYEAQGQSVVIGNLVPRERTLNYGIMDLGDAGLHEGCGQVHRLVEKPKPEEAPSTLAVLGRYVLTPATMTLLADAKPTVGGEIQLTDAIDQLCATEGVQTAVFEGKHFDCGDKVGFQMANLYFALNDPFIAPRLKPFVQELVR